MAINLVKGQKIDLTKGNQGLNKLLVGLGWSTNKYRGNYDFDLDASVFLLSENGKVMNNRDFIFYDNLKHSSGGVEHMGDNLVGGSGGDDEQVRITLSSVPANVAKIVFAVTIYDADVRNQNFGQVSNAYIRILNEANNTEIIRFQLDESFSVESAVIVGELYRYNGEWKFNAVGSGFKGGLKALCVNYGVNLEIKSREQGAIELKKGSKINLEKQGGGSLGEILINLNWNQREQRGGFLSGLFGPKQIDLDLGCLFEMNNGDKGCVQALGNAFGSLYGFPYISLDGDDRSGANKNGENMRINGQFISQIKRVLVYTFIYEGAINWAEAKGVVTVKCPGTRDIIVRMDEYGSSLGMCAIAMFENNGKGGFSVEKLVRFFSGHQDMDRAYNWNMRWVAGRK